jgi:4'-phosphopantetheinyl transferase EntD
VSSKNPLRLAIVPDPPHPIDTVLARLSLAERTEAQRRTGTAWRHFVLGRLAGHAAIRRVLGAGDATVEVIAGPAGEPRARIDGARHPVSVSIAHVSRMAVACAWRTAPDYAAGVDLERVRPTRIAESDYAFSARERQILSSLPQSAGMAGLAGWASKEAAWKALWPSQPPSPAALEIRALSLAAGRAVVTVGGRYSNLGEDTAIRTRLVVVEGPDGAYVLTMAEVGARRPTSFVVRHVAGPKRPRSSAALTLGRCAP